jgi:hypothetical protein
MSLMSKERVGVPFFVRLIPIGGDAAPFLEHEAGLTHDCIGLFAQSPRDWR